MCLVTKEESFRRATSVTGSIGDVDMEAKLRSALASSSVRITPCLNSIPVLIRGLTLPTFIMFIITAHLTESLCLLPRSGTKDPKEQVGTLSVHVQGRLFKRWRPSDCRGSDDAFAKVFCDCLSRSEQRVGCDCGAY